MKYILAIIVLFISIAGAAVSADPAFAQECGPDENYCLLSPLPELGYEDGDRTRVSSNEDSLGQYIDQIYKYGVGIAIVLAIVMLVVGGIEYMTSASTDGKASGRGRVTAALIGLVLALGSFVLLALVGGDEAVDLDFDRDVTLPGAPERPDPGDPGNPLFECLDDNENNGSEGLTPQQTQWACENGGTPVSSFNPDNMDFSSEACQDSKEHLSENRIKIEATNLFRANCGIGTNREAIRTPNPADGTWICVDTSTQCEEGTPEACFQDIQQNAQLNEKEIFCDPDEGQRQDYRGATSEYEQIEFKLDIENAPFDEIGNCYKLDREDDVEDFARGECEDEYGGELRVFNDPAQLDGTYCITPANEDICQEITEGEYMELSGLSDEDWDQNFCDSRNISQPPFPDDVTRAQVTQFEELFEQFTNEMAVSPVQTSGYYNDKDYEENASPDGQPHAGIDLDGDTGEKIKAPVSGDVVKLWDANDGSYSNNGKVGIIDDNDRLWVFTHVQNMENIGTRVEAGTPIAEVGVDGGGGSHIHMEVHNDANVAYNGGDPQDPYDEGLRSGLHDGTMTEGEAQDNTMCPLQAYWENLNGVSS